MASHTDHDHPNTKAARAACRRAGGTGGDVTPGARAKRAEPTLKRRPKEKAGDRLGRLTDQRRTEADRLYLETRTGDPACIHDHVARFYITTPAGSRATRYVCEEPGCDAVQAHAFGGAAAMSSLHIEAEGKSTR